MTKRSRRTPAALVFALAISSAVVATPSWAAVVTDLFGTNATPTSFTVAWWADEAATGTVEVFLDAGGALDLTPFVTMTNLADGNAAARGLVAIRVAGLAPATEYFVRTTTLPTGGGPATIEPAATPLLGIRTVGGTERIAQDLSSITNDLLTLGFVESDTVTPVMGGLVVAIVEGATRPIAGFVGDGIAAPLALLDLNNLYTTGAPTSLATGGGETVTQVALGGFTGADQSSFSLPAPSGLAAPVSAGPAMVLGGLLADVDADGLSDPLDNCPTTPNGFRPGTRGPDGGIQVDQDADGLGDACDPTPVPEPSGGIAIGALLVASFAAGRRGSRRARRDAKRGAPRLRCGLCEAGRLRLG